MDLVQIIAVLGILYLAFWKSAQLEGVMLYALAGIASIAYGLSWRGTYDTAAGLVFSLVLIGLGLYCLCLAVYNIIIRLRSR